MKKQTVPISGPMITEKTRKFAFLLGNNNFKASNGRLISFHERHGIVFKTIAGEEKLCLILKIEQTAKNNLSKKVLTLKMAGATSIMILSQLHGSF